MLEWNLLIALLTSSPSENLSELQEKQTFFVTNRQIHGRRHVGFGYKSADALSYGSCDLNSSKATLYDRQKWFANLMQSSEWKAHHELVFFVHGYSMSYKKTRRIATKMMKALGRPVVFFSWPSRANPLAYSHDQAAAGSTAPEVAQVLDDLAKTLGSENIIVVCHSLGGRIIQEALTADAGNKKQEQPDKQKFKAIYFCSPDIDEDSFLSSADTIKNECDEAKIISSKHDIRLSISEMLHRDKSVGLWRDSAPNFGGIDVLLIDSDNRSDWGHGIPIEILRKLIDRGGDAPHQSG